MPVLRAPLLPAVLLAGALTLAGCGMWDSVDEVAEPQEPAVTTAAPVATPSPAPQPRVALSAALADDRDVPGGPFAGRVEVTAHPLATGLPPELGVSFGADCGLADDTTTQYVAVDVTFTNASLTPTSFAGDVTLSPGNGVELYVGSHDPDRYCQDGAAAARTDHFDASATYGTASNTFTVYVVARGDGSPQAQAAGARLIGEHALAFKNLENTAHSYAEPDPVARWEVRGLVAGGPCIDDPAALCAPLG